jgi:hypothetical protein
LNVFIIIQLSLGKKKQKEEGNEGERGVEDQGNKEGIRGAHIEENKT